MRVTPPALKKMYKRYFKKCYSIALYFVQSTSSAEDVLSDVFLTLWHKRENLRDVKDWDSYLFITTKNHAITFLEKNRQDNLSSIDQIIIEIPGKRPHAGRKVTQERYGRMYAASYPATA